MKSLLTKEIVPPAVLEVVSGLQAGGFRAFLVGGCVRDMLRGQPPKDFDVASSARVEDVQKLFKKVIPTGVEHGTVTVVLRGQHVEVTTFRAEADYVDGRRPSKVVFHEDIEADLGRRDFTMNAIAWNPATGELVDPFGGQADLAARTVRCVRDAIERFSEDGLRPLRAVRFATVLDFTLEPATEAAIPRTLAIFRKVAAERVHQEFTKLLLAPKATMGLRLLASSGLLAQFMPEAAAAEFDAVGVAPKDEVIRMALLLLGQPQPREVMIRLKFPNRTAEDTAALVLRSDLPPPEATDAQLRRWLAKLDAARAPQLLSLHEARLTAPIGLRGRVEAILATNPPLTTRQLALDGKAIMAALGTGPSPAIGHATRHLLELVLDDPSLNTTEALQAALKGWIPPP
ncbi:MAG: [cytidine(C)-cytidine(C)-adenosine (A)]-adding enzyme [Archangium sp.]|nr:[cytidine(C)-cytidine(C)-adenosine (A)]-adding enzyme [Archangium sp.]